MFDDGNLEWGEAVAGRETSCLNQWARAFIGWGRGLHAGTAQSALTVILKLSSVVWPASSWLFKVQLIFSLEKEMATHSSVLAWRIRGLHSLVGCCLWGRTESDTTEATQQQQSLVTGSVYISWGQFLELWQCMYGCESWRKNWCFWTVVLEKTLESPLGCKEIQLVHPKGNQSWMFIGRTDVEAETPILWPPDAKSWLI